MLNEIIRIFANDLIFIPVILATVVYFRLKTREQRLKFFAIVIIAGILALIFSRIGGMLIDNPRPFVADPNLHPLIPHARDNGFPSDHTLLGAFASFVMMIFAPAFGVAGIILTLLIGAGRVMANVHHPLDILGSFIFAGAAVLIAFYSVKIWFAKSKFAKKLLKSSNKIREKSDETSRKNPENPTKIRENSHEK